MLPARPSYAPGFYPNLGDDSYRTADGVNQTLLGWMNESGAHALEYLKGTFNKDTDATRFGRMAHRCVLQPERVASTYIVVPADAPNKPTKKQLQAKKPSPETIAAIQWWDSFRAQNIGKEIVDAEDNAICQRMIEAVYADPDCKDLLEMAGGRELAAFAVDPITGLNIKALFDLLPDEGDTIIDFKTCVSTKPREWAKHVALFGYHRQAAFYLDIANLLGREMRRFVFVATEKEPPFNPVAYQIDSGSIEKGRQENRRLLAEYAECVRTNHWPGYNVAGGTKLFSIPRWALNEQPDQNQVEYTLEVI